MSPPTSPVQRSWKDSLRTLAMVIVFSNAVVLLLQLLNPDAPAGLQLLTSNVIGLSIWSLTRLLRWLSRGAIGAFPGSLLATPPGVLAGLAARILAGSGEQWLPHDWRTLLTPLLIALAGNAYMLRDRAAAEYRARLEVERRQAAEARQGEAMARLALLQAQIEPHFLFNTLANVQSMIEREPRTAAEMLEHLNRYLRASLSRTRTTNSTCEEEIVLIDALLTIAAIRLGPRLRYRIDLPPELRRSRLPPLLLQPLVENALRHGIEPAVRGGEIEVSIQAQGSILLLRVRDTGVGFSEAAPGGVGLSNVRARLAALYGEQGQLSLHREAPGSPGTIAQIRLPLVFQ